MQFKHPEILYFLLLLLIPILVHLFQWRRFKKEYFTNVAFLKVLSVQTRKSSKLKKWLLLLTRLLLLAAIIFAFAQPFFTAQNNNKVNNDLYIILDNSFSMQSKGQKGELLKRAVEDLLTNAPENQMFSLITSTETFWNTDIKTIRKDLQNLKYSAAPFEIDVLMDKIKLHQPSVNKDIVVITDGLDLNKKQLDAVKKNLNTSFIIPKAEQTSNISIDSVFVAQTSDQFYDITVQLSSFGGLFNDIPVALYNNDKLAAKTLVTFEKSTKNIKFTLPNADFNGYVSVQDNRLEFDNTYYFNISKPKKLKVLSIGSLKNNEFLNKIYSDAEFTFSSFELASLDYNSIDKQDAIILNELEQIPQALQTTLQSFANNGGTLVVIPSEKIAVSNLNQFVSKLGNLKYNAIQKQEKLITKIAANHPVFTNVFDGKIVNFQYPKTKNYFAISSTYAAILSYDDQSAFLTAVQNQNSNVFLFAAPLNADNSNFINSPLVVPVFYKMAQQNNSNGILAIEISQNKPYFLEANLAKDEIVTIKNTEQRFIPIQQIKDQQVKLTFNDLPTDAGNFGIYTSNNLLKNISFNYNRTESNLNKANAEILKNVQKIDSVETLFDNIALNKNDSAFWKWLVILALVFLVLEILIQKFFK